VNVQSWKEKSLIPLTAMYGVAEAKQMLRILLEERLNDSSIWQDNFQELQEHSLELLEQDLQALLHSKPLQYILQQAWFMDMTLKVNESTLIPRPETEELLELILNDAGTSKNLSILDIGTGSGCIPIYLLRQWKEARVEAVDISTEAIAIAKENAANYQVDVNFSILDILRWRENIADDKIWDIIISNPPYIPLAEKDSLADNVKNYEPALALFVPDEDPLLFYRAVAELSLKHLRQGGRLYFEIHAPMANALLDLLLALGYTDTSIFLDLQGKKRMLRATAPIIGGMAE